MSDTTGPDGWLPLLSEGPPAVKRWLADVEPGQQSPPQTWDWLGLGEATASLARSTLDLEWAEIAIYVYDRLARKVESPSRRESLMYSQMNLRAFLITRLGARAGDPVLDPQPIVDWFMEILRVSPEEAADESSHWTDLEIARVRELRRIKNRLAPIKLLDQAGMLPRELQPTLHRWLSVRDQLP